MNPYIALDKPNEVAGTTRITPRKRCPLPPQDARDWRTPGQTALALGCSVATVHRHDGGPVDLIERGCGWVACGFCSTECGSIGNLLEHVRTF